MPKTDTSVDLEQAKDARLLGQLEKHCNKLDTIVEIAYSLFSKGTAGERMYQLADMLMKATEQHRKVALTIHNIRHPKSTVFVKNQVNQLQIKTDKLQQQIEGTKNAQMDSSSKTKAEAIDIRAQTLA